MIELVMEAKIIIDPVVCTVNPSRPYSSEASMCTRPTVGLIRRSRNTRSRKTTLTRSTQLLGDTHASLQRLSASLWLLVG